MATKVVTRLLAALAGDLTTIAEGFDPPSGMSFVTIEVPPEVAPASHSLLLITPFTLKTSTPRHAHQDFHKDFYKDFLQRHGPRTYRAISRCNNAA